MNFLANCHHTSGKWCGIITTMHHSAPGAIFAVALIVKLVFAEVEAAAIALHSTLYTVVNCRAFAVAASNWL